MDSSERSELAGTVGQILTAAGPAGWQEALHSFGWDDLCADEPVDAIRIIAPLQGKLLPNASFVDRLALAVSGVPQSERTTTHLLYPALGSDQPTSTVSPGGNLIEVRGTANFGPIPSGSLITPAVLDGALALVEIADTDALSTNAAGIDPDSGWFRVVGTADCTVVSTGEEAQRQWLSIRAHSMLAISLELNALGARMLELAVEHVSSRNQFGRALGSFQAVKQGLADTRAWQECADLSADAAPENPGIEAALVASSLAGRFFRSAAENCQQYLGGMGFTWEHPFHTFLRRGLILERLLGSSAEARSELGATFKAGAMPALSAI
ncbi:acyl-CoA dehydrogenase family protein [Nocardia sp. 348MFTsu5.1]|uniref:acyl-CoA dehydrogenase family protein n=1 Tax=Nocardia sp. 348MFTsu5.1 TaxID=1172185 RepID=UPI000377A340|nr:acyl-CoA dehydrogenase family protein [Nocardia sp. 348MFTsu5.1]